MQSPENELNFVVFLVLEIEPVQSNQPNESCVRCPASSISAFKRSALKRHGIGRMPFAKIELIIFDNEKIN